MARIDWRGAGMVLLAATIAIGAAVGLGKADEPTSTPPGVYMCGPVGEVDTRLKAQGLKPEIGVGGEIEAEGRKVPVLKVTWTDGQTGQDAVWVQTLVAGGAECTIAAGKGVVRFP